MQLTKIFSRDLTAAPIKTDSVPCEASLEVKAKTCCPPVLKSFRSAIGVVTPYSSSIFNQYNILRSQAKAFCEHKVYFAEQKQRTPQDLLIDHINRIKALKKVRTSIGLKATDCEFFTLLRVNQDVRYSKAFGPSTEDNIDAEGEAIIEVNNQHIYVKGPSEDILDFAILKKTDKLKQLNMQFIKKQSYTLSPSRALMYKSHGLS